MRQYFSKAVLVDHPLIDEMCDELGNDAYRFLTILTDLWQEIGEFEITAKLLKQRCRINAQKSERIIERFSKYFKESLKILKLVEESSEILNNLEESSGKLNKVEESSTLEGENTDGRNKSITRKDIDKDKDIKEKTVSITNGKTKKKKSEETDAPDLYPVDEKLSEWLSSKNYPVDWAEYEIAKCLRWFQEKSRKRSNWYLTILNWLEKADIENNSLAKWKSRQSSGSTDPKYAHFTPAERSTIPGTPEFMARYAY